MARKNRMSCHCCPTVLNYAEFTSNFAGTCQKCDKPLCDSQNCYVVLDDELMCIKCNPKPKQKRKKKEVIGSQNVIVDS